MNTKAKKWLRWIIFLLTIAGSILAIVCGSKYYIAGNSKIGAEYSGGAQVLVEVNRLDGTPIEDETFTDNVAKNINKRLNPDSVNADLAKREGQNRIRVSQAGIDKNGIDNFVKTIVTKPTLEIYDVTDRPLFLQNDDGTGVKFNVTHKEPDPQYQSVGNPIASESTTAKLLSSGWQVLIGLKPEVLGINGEWEKATKAISSQKSRMIMWLDREAMLSKIHSSKFLTDEFNKSGKNLYTFSHIDNDLKKPLRKHTIDASKYLASDATVSQVLTGNNFVITGKFTSQQANKLADDINYGATEYAFEELSSNFIDADYGSSAFEKVMLAGIIVVSLISIFMIVNYGILGVLSTISLSLYIFLTLMMFTVMRGEYSPETVAALILGMGMSVDANIITFERLKNEVYSGASIKKSFAIANRTSISTIVDANITTLVVAFSLFFFGENQVKGFSISLTLSILFTLIIMLVFTRLLASILVKNNIFNKYAILLGVKSKIIKQTKPKKLKASISKFDFMKHSKWFVIGSSSIFVTALIVFAIFAGIGGSISSGFSRSLEFKGGQIIDIYAEKNRLIDQSRVDEIINVFRRHQYSGDIKVLWDSTHTNASIKIVSDHLLVNWDSIKSSLGGTQFDYISSNSLQSESISTTIAKELVVNAMIAISISFAGIILYTLFRFKWTYGLAAIIALVHDVLMVVAIFVICRIKISPIFIAGLLSIVGYSINDTIVTFDRIRELINDLPKKTILADPKIMRKLANKAIVNTIKRSLLTSFTTLMAVVVLMSFGNATKIGFNIALLVGLISGTYSSIFIATYIWVKLEVYSQKRKLKRIKSDFWNTGGIDEQVFEGINEIN